MLGELTLDPIAHADPGAEVTVRLDEIMSQWCDDLKLTWKREGWL
jgi:hypothetical protein